MNQIRFIWLSVIIGLTVITACSAIGEKKAVNLLDEAMTDVFTYELNQVEPEHEEQVRNWLEQARRDGTDGQFHVLSIGNDDDEFKYTYVYQKGSSDYEVHFIYNPQDSTFKTRLHVTGNMQANSGRDGFVQIRILDDQLSSLIIVSEEPLNVEHKEE